jgi:hypothetical protein
VPTAAHLVPHGCSHLRAALEALVPALARTDVLRVGGCVGARDRTCALQLDHNTRLRGCVPRASAHGA